jgi:hypothetical protein
VKTSAAITPMNYSTLTPSNVEGTLENMTDPAIMESAHDLIASIMGDIFGVVATVTPDESGVASQLNALTTPQLTPSKQWQGTSPIVDVSSSTKSDKATSPICFTPSPKKKRSAASSIAASPIIPSLNRSISNQIFFPTTENVLLTKDITRLVERLRKHITNSDSVKILPALNGTAHELMILRRTQQKYIVRSVWAK